MAIKWPTLLPSLDPAALRARITQRPYWAVRFTDGRIIAQWQRDWLDLPRKGRQSIRLYCPNSEVRELGSSVDATDRLFQFTVAVASSDGRRGDLAQVIGMIHSTNGDCTLYAWDNQRGCVVGPLEDNAGALRYHGVGKLSNLHLGIKAD